MLAHARLADATAPPRPYSHTTAMTTISFIGSGNIGGTVARLSVAAGYDVVLSNSRGPQTLTDLVQELGPRARRLPRPRRRQRAS